MDFQRNMNLMIPPSFVDRINATLKYLKLIEKALQIYQRKKLCTKTFGINNYEIRVKIITKNWSEETEVIELKILILALCLLRITDGL